MGNNSGSDLLCGRTNGAEDGTILVGQKQDDGTEFSQDFVFQAGPFVGPERSPRKTIDGIRGLGWNGQVSSGQAQGGRGVLGLGGPHMGTGVEGRGGGFNGRGGIGVNGRGGDGSLQTFAPAPLDPGIGITGRGGLQDKNEDTGKPHGAGVVGVAGAGDSPLPSFSATGGVGVFGLGGNAVRKTQGTTLVGPRDPGPGVLGKGGMKIVDGVADTPGTGVIGLAGNVVTSVLAAPRVGTGVHGEGTIGVSGTGNSDQPGGFFVSEKGIGVGGIGNGDQSGGFFFSQKGHGVLGNSGDSRGGVFLSASAAQVRLIPHVPGEMIQDELFSDLKRLNVKEADKRVLPKNGQIGDLLCTSMKGLDGRPVAVLWFCVKEGDGRGPAEWCQVMLGPAFTGTG